INIPDDPYTQIPWEHFTQIQPDPPLTEWTNQWRQFIHNANPQLGLDKVIPEVRIDPEWKPATDPLQVAERPPGYLVLGEFGMPLSITHPDSDTQRPVLIKDAGLDGVDEDALNSLDKNGVRYVSQLAGSNIESI